MRAGRLVALLLILERRGRTTASRLARELEVSERTIHRDIDGLMEAGVPIVTIRGPRGGFELVGGYRSGLRDHPNTPPTTQSARSADVRLSAEGRRLATLLGRPSGLRTVRSIRPDESGWIRARFGFESIDAATVDVLGLGSEVEVLQPLDLRQHIAAVVRQVSAMYGDV